MNAFEEQEKDWLTKYYSSAIGLEIVGFKWRESTAADDDAEVFQLDWFEQFPVLICRDKAGVTVEIDVSRDEEGNGRGFLFGLVRPGP